MFTILASLVGFFSTLFPDIIKYFQNRQDNSHELEVMKLQIEREKLGLSAQAEAIALQTQAQVQTAAYQTEGTSKIKWIDGINDLVRPTIALLVIFDYILVTVLSYNALTMAGQIDSSTSIIDVLWNTDDRTVFTIIISYYFGRLISNK